MDYKKETISFNDCTCNFSLTLRIIIELGLRPVMYNIATIVSASLTNKELFKYYEVDYIFMLGDPFNLYYNLPMYNAYIVLLQQLIRIAIELKEKDTQGFVIQESLSDLIRPLTLNKPFMYSNFFKGNLHQVLNDTFAVRFLYKKLYGESEDYFYLAWVGSFNDDRSDFVVKDMNFFALFRVDQIIPITGLTTKISFTDEFPPETELLAGNLLLIHDMNNFNSSDRISSTGKFECYCGKTFGYYS